MSSVPGKSPDKELRPLFAGSLGFGLMLACWWICTFEIPGRTLFRLATQPGVDRHFAPITVWAYVFTQDGMSDRIWAIAAILIAVFVHRLAWVRRPRWDVFGIWVFKAGFLILYILLYGTFFLVFLGAEFPIWQSKL